MQRSGLTIGDTEMATTVIIAGVARGGTSMTTGLIHALGVHVPHMVNAQQRKYNPQGNFENFFDCGGIVQKLNAHLMLPEYDGTKLPPESVVDKLAFQYGHELRQMFVGDHAEGKDIWAFKLPGNNPFILPVFLKVIPNLKIVHVRRNIEDNAASYKHLSNGRLSLDQARTDVLKCRKTFDLILNAWSGPKFGVGFYALKRDPYQYVDSLSKFLDVVPPDDIKERIKDLIDPEWSTIDRF